MSYNAQQLDLFRNSLPRKFYCANSDFSEMKVRRFDTGQHYRYIQPNDFNSKLWLVYDVDRPTCVSEVTDDLDLPAPNFFVQNRTNHHAHLYYGLEQAVHLNASSSQGAIRYAAAVDCAMTLKLDADASYRKLIAKNPLNDYWRTYAINDERMTLDYLDQHLDLTPFSDKRRNLPESGLGRNCNLFDRLRKWSYKAIRQGWPDYQQWYKAVEERAVAYNYALAESAMDFNEIKHIAKSVATWTHKNFSAASFSATQARRGARGGKVSKRSNDPNSARTLKPWELQNISRATYYRRIKNSETK